jgi:hypothetical protein
VVVQDADYGVVTDTNGGSFHLTHLIIGRLLQDNYLLWHAQILPLLCRRHLEGYIDGSLPCLPRSVPAMTASSVQVTALNPAHCAWVAQDHAILSPIQSSLTESIAGLVLFASSSYDAWTMLEASFSSQSTAQSMSLRRQLGDMKKCDQPTSVYFNNIKTLADRLSSIGEPLRDSEFMGFVL